MVPLQKVVQLLLMQIPQVMFDFNLGNIVLQVRRCSRKDFCVLESAHEQNGTYDTGFVAVMINDERECVQYVILIAERNEQLYF